MINRPNMNNIINLIKNYMSKGNPQQLIQQMYGGNNTMINNLLQMAQNGKRQDIETFARNYCKEQGKDFDVEFNKFMNNFK